MGTFTFLICKSASTIGILIEALFHEERDTEFLIQVHREVY
jgi:hypothetical protein